GHTVDHLVLIGSPIDGTFLDMLRKHGHIRKVVVIDLTEHGDPIHAGMSQLSMVAAVPKLASQMAAGNGEGHFYYAHMVPDLSRRLQKLAARVADEGVR
ncbi:hypothetical protein C2U69_29015, partial [Cupriavidus pinatubonensis]